MATRYRNCTILDVPSWIVTRGEGGGGAAAAPLPSYRVPVEASDTLEQCAVLRSMSRTAP